MSEYPIIFSAPMIRALLDGRKTQTRRLAWQWYSPRYGGGPHRKPSPWQRVKPGDKLWVREAWKPHSMYAATKPRDVPPSKAFYAADEAYAPSNTGWRPSIHMPRWASRLTLIVTATKIERVNDIGEQDAVAEGMVFRDHGLNRWRQQAEGWHFDPDEAARGADYCLASARNAFGNLWEKLHGVGSFDAAPEVVALTFTVEQRNIDSGKEAA